VKYKYKNVEILFFYTFKISLETPITRKLNLESEKIVNNLEDAERFDLFHERRVVHFFVFLRLIVQAYTSKLYCFVSWSLKLKSVRRILICKVYRKNK